MSGSFTASNGLLTLIFDTRFIPATVYQSATLHIHYSIDLGGAASLLTVCDSTFTQLATLDNRTPCNSTYVPQLQIPDTLVSPDTCVAFSCASPGTTGMTQADFVNVVISARFCLPTNPVDCAYTLGNDQGTNLLKMIHPVSLSTLGNSNSTAMTSTATITFPLPFVFPGNSNPSNQKALIAGLSCLCAILIMALAVFICTKGGRRISENVQKVGNIPTASADAQINDSLPDSSIPIASAPDSNSSEVLYIEKQPIEQHDMFRGMTRLQRAATSSSQFIRDPTNLQQNQHESVEVAVLPAQQLPEYALLGLPPAYSDSVPEADKSVGSGSK